MIELILRCFCLFHQCATMALSRVCLARYREVTVTDCEVVQDSRCDDWHLTATFTLLCGHPNYYHKGLIPFRIGQERGRQAQATDLWEICSLIAIHSNQHDCFLCANIWPLGIIRYWYLIGSVVFAMKFVTISAKEFEFSRPMRYRTIDIIYSSTHRCNRGTSFQLFRHLTLCGPVFQKTC